MNEARGNSGPIIVSALFGTEDFAFVDAHLTLFHHLPPSVEPELKARLAGAVRARAPAAMLAGVISLGDGTAFRIESEGLNAIRTDLRHAFVGLLTPQDMALWRAHVTVQNKVSPGQARALKNTLEADFAPRPVRIAGLAAWWYRGGPWEPLSRHMFRG